MQQYKLVNSGTNASFENSRNWTQKDCDNIGKELKKHIQSMFEKSKNRMNKPIENYFIFANIFRIQLETEYLFKHEARGDIPDLLNFFCSLGIGSKKEGKPDVFPRIDVTEHQLNALLHISTLMTAFQSYSEGVI